MKMLCIGRNYVDHARELNNEIPDRPLVFMKPASALFQGEIWHFPHFSRDVHYECEWVVRLGKKAKNVQETEALEHIDAMTLGIDFTARDVQSELKEKGHPWELAKAFDGSAMLGEWQEFSPEEQVFRFYRGEELLQEGHTELMMFKLPYLIHYCSKIFTLEKGDVIFTGTPKGVAPLELSETYSAYLGAEKLLSFNVADGATDF